MQSDSDLSDPLLRELRGTINKTMIPLLIKIFELKLAMQQAHHPPSRLHKKAQQTPEEIAAELISLRKDLRLLSLWVEGADKQIERALSTAEEKQPVLDKERIQAPTPAQEEKMSTLLRLKKWVWK